MKRKIRSPSEREGVQVQIFTYTYGVSILIFCFVCSFHPFPHFPPLLANISLIFICGSVSVLFLFVCFGFLHSTYKRNHTVLVFLCRIYSTQHNVLQVQPHCCRQQGFSLFSTSSFSIKLSMDSLITINSLKPIDGQFNQVASIFQLL